MVVGCFCKKATAWSKLKNTLGWWKREHVVPLIFNLNKAGTKRQPSKFYSFLDSRDNNKKRTHPVLAGVFKRQKKLIWVYDCLVAEDNLLLNITHRHACPDPWLVWTLLWVPRGSWKSRLYFWSGFPESDNIDGQTPALLSFWIYCNTRHRHSGYPPNISPLDPLGTFEDDVPFPWGGMIY